MPRNARILSTPSPAPGGPPKVLGAQTVVGALVAALTERILSGEFPEGMQLRQATIAEDYGISRIPVREALRQLEAEGLIVVYPHRGAVVPTLSLTEIAEFFDLRALLECDQLARAIPLFDQRHAAKAAAVLDEFDAVLLDDRDVNKWGESNWRFHSTLYSPAERPRAMQIIRDLHHRTDRYSRMQLLFTDWRKTAQEEHRELLELCRRGDVAGGREFLEKHIQRAGRALVRFLEEHRRQATLPGDQPAVIVRAES